VRGGEDFFTGFMTDITSERERASVAEV